MHRFFKITLFCIFIFAMFSCPSLTGAIQIDIPKDSINVTDSQGNKQGLWHILFPSGKIKEKGKYVDNNKQGEWICYYENGNLQSKITYTNNDPFGPATFYYENGKIRESGNWQLDHWVGNYKYYYESGQLSYDWNYNEAGKRDGEQKYYHNNGNSMYEGLWNNGKTEGTLKVFNEQGKLIQEKQYNNGVFAKTKAVAPDDSNMDNDRPRLKFEGTGNYTIFSDENKISAKGFFVKGLLFNGEKFNYDTEGTLTSITHYANGKKGETKQR